MNAKRNNIENTTSNQIAFEKFCELSQKGYYICVELKSRLRDQASFWITATKENEEREEIQLFLNEEILDLVLNYLESGKLGDISKINPSDLESFNEKSLDFKLELFQAEKGKGKKVVRSCSIFEKLASINYKHGIIIFHPYPFFRDYTNTSSTKTKPQTSSISEDALIEIEINNLNFGSAYSLKVLSDYYTITAVKNFKNNSLIGNKDKKENRRSSINLKLRWNANRKFQTV